jgi:L-fuconolactonase
VTERIRFFDTHVHFWDPARPDWYPQLAPDHDFSAIGLGLATGMKRLYDRDTYLSDAATIEVDGIVHVTVTRGAGNYLAETAHLGQLHDASGLPTALVGGFNPHAELSVIADELDTQGKVPILAAVRTMEPVDFEAAKTAQLLELVAERDLVFDVVTHPDEMLAVVRQLAKQPDATYVVEHTGWPLVADDPAHTLLWRDGMRALAGLGPNVHCKLSGLAMTLHTFDLEAQRPWLEYALEVFGPDRCLFGSNFPVDALFGDLASLIRTYDAVSSPLGAEAQAKLFSGNARAVYGARATA